MNISTIWRGAAAAILMVGLGACGSSSGGATSSGTSTGSADATKSIDSVDVDMNNLNASTSSASANISVGKAVGSQAKAMGDDVGDSSRSGCEANSLIKEGLRNTRGVGTTLCYLGTAQRGNTAFVVDETQRFYSVSVGDFGFLMRIQKASGTLTMDLCEGSALSEELSVTQSSTTVAASGYHHFKGESGEGGAGFEDKMSFALDLTLKSDASGDIDYTDIDAGSLTANFNGSYGQGQLSYAKLSAQDVNDVSGIFKASFGSSDAFTAQLAARMGASKGTAKHSVTGSFPGIPTTSFPASITGQIPAGQVLCPIGDMDSCDPGVNFATLDACRSQTPALSCFCMETATSCSFTDSGTEAFDISYNTTTKKHTFTVANSSSGEYYYDHVNALTLPSDVGTPAPSRNWDCSTTGQTVTAIDVSSVDFSTCDALAAEAFDSSDHSSCEEQEGGDKGGEGVNSM